MKKLIIANWKCNPTTLKEAKALFESTKANLKNAKGVEIVICPPFLYLLNLNAKNSRLKLGGQDCFWENKGAYTGEISAAQLKDAGCQYVLVGHSEREKYFSETDEIANQKMRSAIKAKLKPVLCLGDSLEEREKGNVQQALFRQAEKALKGMKKDEIKNLFLAYEPVWAIGTGKPCSVGEAQTMRLYLRKILAKLYSMKISESVPILYGGSVNSKNAKTYIAEAGMQGVLVGGGSLNAKELADIVRAVR